ncbi:nicotinate-nucleotide adenylyltransferase [Lysobacter pythonis]|uniref:Probable nicotinate-nucleotide adenylyltransferase n=1 Tax=Solilutibacter pythonis TaxID=2483112 RepID=A0A3M2HZ84_9GAMM|nr:nicotinate-nucleotide adenylyltransferase [Lysobacter pythonis]RMH91164.1 nicotinate-nucleotide adenylyltransferase [Lysobacter pythonis]
MSLRIQYGGSFDPVHEGHLAVARAARDALAAGVWLMPAGDPPHKGPTAVDAARRREMLALAVAGEPGLAVDERELRREGPSYTIDTLIELRAGLGTDAPLAILVGADSFLALPGWRRWYELAGFAHLVIAERPGSGFDPAALPPELAAFAAGRWAAAAGELARTPTGLLYRLALPLRPESSSELRRRIAGHDPRWREWVPPAVADYIVRHRLYGAGRDASFIRPR